MAVQYGINTLAQLHRDKMTKQASDNLAAAVDGQRGALDRFFAMQQFNPGGINTTTTTTTNTTDSPTQTRRGGYRSMKKKRNKYGK